MKKLISLALALVLILSLIACGAKQDNTPDRRRHAGHHPDR